MIPRFAFVLVASAALTSLPAQTPAKTAAPPVVEEALRARVNEFFQYHVDRGPALRKAMELVAEDTKDEYYAAGKMEVKQFKITGIAFAEGLEKATVTLDVTRSWIFGTFAEEVTLPMTTAWKIEEGKWVWYKDRSQVALTPMGLSDMEAAKRASEAGQGPGGVNLKDLADPDKLKQQAEAILGKAGLDRNAVEFTLGQPGEDTLVYRNNYFGSVILELYDSVEAIPGLSVSLSKKTLGANEEAQVVIRYNPPAPEKTDEAGQQAAAPKAVEKVIRLALQPFNRELPFTVRIAPPAATEETADKNEQ